MTLMVTGVMAGSRGIVGGARLAGHPGGYDHVDYVHRDPAASAQRRHLANWIRAQVGDETDSFDEPWTATPRGPVKPCGTTAAYQRHRRRGEQPCDTCAQAHRAELQESWRNRKAEAPKARADVAERLEAVATLPIYDGYGQPEPGQITIDQAAERLGVHRRTVIRYRRRIREQEEMAS